MSRCRSLLPLFPRHQAHWWVPPHSQPQRTQPSSAWRPSSLFCSIFTKGGKCEVGPIYLSHSTPVTAAIFTLPSGVCGGADCLSLEGGAPFRGFEQHSQGVGLAMPGSDRANCACSSGVLTRSQLNTFHG